ncbi:hypothetical protein [Spirosoma panaciterrae]|uniref:hypothetical protein n=1 Tax=Spirosoma panaciterrae TaxID=496058 RepID=UPI0003659158|nr:hypothetical protein [Spirosoma panaciterrae]
MKALTAIGFLVLLLYHWIGLPLAVFTFEQGYESATPVSTDDQWKVVKLPISLPYTSAWENTDGHEGLIQDGDEFYNIVHQQYANDTLYTVLKTNQNAKERFFDLAEQLQEMNSNDQSLPKTPLGRLLKLLGERFTTYLPPSPYYLAQPDVQSLQSSKGFGVIQLAYAAIGIDAPSPPPKQ